MKLFIIFFSFLFFKHCAGELCDEENIVEVSLIRDNWPHKRIFTKEVDGVNKTFQCVCKNGVCYHKCCPFGYVINVTLFMMTKQLCWKKDEDDLLYQNGMSVHSMSEFKRKINLRQPGEFSFLYGKPCLKVYKSSSRFAVQEDGRLWIEVPNQDPPWMYRSPEEYCIDTLLSVNPDTNETEAHLDALVCSLNEDEGARNVQYILTSTCMIISCVFILATLGVYAWLPELRNLHGRVLMAYLSCLLVAFAFLAAMQILILSNSLLTINLCLALTIVIYYALVAAFFWLNVMSFDIWWTFSGKRGLALEKLSSRARFGAYCLYAFGVPALLTILLLVLEFAPLPNHALRPHLRTMGCFIYGKAKLLYLYGPMIILCLANIVFFILTAMKIARIKKQTSVLNSKDSSSTHDSQSKDRQRLLLYLKLFAVMGVSWILEVVSAMYPDLQFWKITDAYNVLVGLIIFIIFVCKKKILRLMKKRYAQLRGEPMSNTQMSCRTLSSRDDIRMNSIKNNNNGI